VVNRDLQLVSLPKLFTLEIIIQEDVDTLLVTMRSVKSMVRGSLYDFEVGGKDAS